VNGGLTLGAVYERTVAASLERVWENVHDWEHLPFLHASSFCDLVLETAEPWGWRARVQVPPRENPRELLIELRREEGAERYHTRTLAGFGAGGDIATTLEPRGDRETGVHVEFWLSEQDPSQAKAIGQAMVGLYTRLWDEDEEMMIQRQAFLDVRRAAEPAPECPKAIALGSPESVRARAPFFAEVGGQRVRVLEHQGQLAAHSLVCPHLGAPLDGAELREGHVVCPWHGYRFSLSTGLNPDGRRCRLAHPAQIVADAAGELQLSLA
jgi:nitrite reductase/ring-hydroxylating ferredoxin subunit